MVLEAIEEAMDVDGLTPWDRGRLADLHDRAAWHIGQQTKVPEEWLREGAVNPARALRDALDAQSAFTDPLESAYLPGGTMELSRFGVNWLVCRCLARSYRTVESVAAATDADLLAVHRVGPVRLEQIRAAVAKHQTTPALHEARG
jgi:hypothetical protein